MRAGLCEACGRRPAEYVLSRVVGRRSDERRLCTICAGDAERLICGDSGISLVELLGNRIGGLLVSQEGNRTKVCPGCGNTVDEAKRTGMLGCSMCYVVFREDIEPLIAELHGPGKWSGGAPE